MLDVANPHLSCTSIGRSNGWESGKSGKCARGRGPQTKDSTSFKAAFMLAPMDPPPPENPLFPLRLDTSVGGGGTDERLHHDQLNTRSVACKNSQPSLRLWGR